MVSQSSRQTICMINMIMICQFFHFTDEFVTKLLILIQSVLLLCPTTVEGKKIDFHFRPSDCQIFDLECVSNWKAGIGIGYIYIPK